MVNGELIIRGCFDATTGYGAHIRSHLRLLERNGISFRLLYEPLDPNVISGEDILRWNKLVLKKSPLGSTVIHFLEACYYEICEGCRNIGYTQWEVEGLPQPTKLFNPDLQWLENFNRCDEIWTGSSFAKEVYINAGVKVPIFVVPWVIGSDFPIKSPHPGLLHGIQIPPWNGCGNLHLALRPIFKILSRLPSFVRLPFVSLGYLAFHTFSNLALKIHGWKLSFTKTTIEQDKNFFTIVCANTFNERKNFRDLIAAVHYEFRASDKVRLVIATHHAVFSRWMRASVLSHILKWVMGIKAADAPQTFVISQKLSEKEFLTFLSHADLFLSTSKGEGVGGGVLLSMALGVPVCTHLFSSFKDYCDDQNAFIFEYSLEPVVWHFNFYGMRQRWARPNMESLTRKLREAYELWKKKPRSTASQRKKRQKVCS